MPDQHPIHPEGSPQEDDTSGASPKPMLSTEGQIAHQGQGRRVRTMRRAGGTGVPAREHVLLQARRLPRAVPQKGRRGP